MSKKIRDPYPITDIYLLEMNAVDAATVTVGDLCERLSNTFDTGIDAPSVKEVTDHFKNIDASKYNSISYGNGADGGYSVYIGVDAKNRIMGIPLAPHAFYSRNAACKRAWDGVLLTLLNYKTWYKISTK